MDALQTAGRLFLEFEPGDPDLGAASVSIEPEIDIIKTLCVYAQF
jgi:hypothetical protein